MNELNFPRTAMDELLMRDLFNANWPSPFSPLQLNERLTLAEVSGSTFFLNTRCLLKALAEQKGAPLTATGKLNRAFVASVLDDLKLVKPYREMLRNFSKVTNEMDVWPLHLVRVICGIARLVQKRNKQLQLTPTGRALLDDDQAGQLFLRLFTAYFQRFDLRYDFHLRDVPALQSTMPVIFHRLHQVARDWIPVRGLCKEILPGPVHAQLRATMVYQFDTEEWILSGYVLKPLLEFGLIEKKKRSEWPGVDEKDAIRTTKLWRKFIFFPQTQNN